MANRLIPYKEAEAEIKASWVQWIKDWIQGLVDSDPCDEWEEE